MPVDLKHKGAETNPTRATPIGPSLSEAIRDAELVFVGRVSSKDDDQVVEVGVVETLKGEAATTIAVALDPGQLAAIRDTKARDGVFITDGETPAHVLFKGNPTYIGKRQVVRLLAGLPAFETEPSDEEIVEMSHHSDLVVFGISTPVEAPKSTIDPNVSEVKLDIIEVLKGKPEGDQLDVVRGSLADSPGGPWSFEPSDEMPGVFFLRREGERYFTISPMPPQAIERQYVKDVLAEE